MKRKIGRLCMVLGAVLILCAAGLLGYNRWDAARAEKASQEVLARASFGRVAPIVECLHR